MLGRLGRLQHLTRTNCEMLSFHIDFRHGCVDCRPQARSLEQLGRLQLSETHISSYHAFHLCAQVRLVDCGPQQLSLEQVGRLQLFHRVMLDPDFLLGRIVFF